MDPLDRDAPMGMRAARSPGLRRLVEDNPDLADLPPHLFFDELAQRILSYFHPK